MMMGYCDLQRVAELVASRTKLSTVGLAAFRMPVLKEAAVRFRFTACKLPIVLMALCLCGWLSSSATAQLRSGRTTRSLYVDETPVHSQNVRSAAVQSSSGQSLPGRNRSTPVVAASYVDSYPDSYSAPSSGSEHTHCDDCGDTSFTAGEGGDAYYDSSGYAGFGPQDCGNAGCGDVGCSSCGGYSDLAPTCSSMNCSTGNGPLLSLWCRMSVRAEVPLYWRRAMGPPPLATTATSGTGALGAATTQILLGGDNDKLDDSAHAGVRLTFSTWLGAEQRYGLMFRYWNAGNQNDTYGFSSNQFPILARPFLSTGANPVQNTLQVGLPGDDVGNLSVTTESKLDGLELTLKRLIYQDRFTRVDWLYGYQHVSIDESLSIFSTTTDINPASINVGNSIAVRDTFRTANDFNGVAYGLMSSRQINCWKMETLVRLGLGNLRRKVNINGTTTTTSGTSQTASQGLLARNTNDHPLVDDTFVIVPEVGINFARQLRPGLDFNVGYNYLMVPKVAQASQQINSNLAVNLSDPLVGALDPSLNLSERNYWISSLGLGLQLRY